MLFLEERIGKLLEQLQALSIASESPIHGFRYIESNEKRADTRALDSSSWPLFPEGGTWGGFRKYFWFDGEATIPDDMAGKPVRFQIKTGHGGWDAINPQFTAYINGEITQGIDNNHSDVLLTKRAAAGEHFRITLSAYTADGDAPLVLDTRLIAVDDETEQYFYDLSIPYKTARLLQRDNDDYIAIIQALNESLNLLDLRQPRSAQYYATLKAARKCLDDTFYKTLCHEKREQIYCVGHTHIDVAWLWTLAVTEEKAVRSFSTVLKYMDEYPEYIFMSSQPQLYKYFKRLAPEGYEKMRARIAEGRWETEGAMFLEADCNLTSGESLVRQILHGKRFFRNEFGKDNRIVWLPDVFGYSAALPQIMEKSGIHYFMTTKISWNEINKLPYDTFMWEGIDGTRILTHFSPSREYNNEGQRGHYETSHFTTYNATLDPDYVKGAWQRYQQKHLSSVALMSYGYGDGGGGPTRAMLEAQRRLARGIPGCPQTVQSTALHFFETLEKQVKNNRRLPDWVGELYLEYHRGTYTSMARNKKYNRKMEFAHLNAERFGLAASLLTGAAYPQDTLLADWEVIERNQFHDILPGSSIHDVYEDSKREYEGITKTVKGLLESSQNAIAARVHAPQANLVVFNPQPYDCDDAVFFDIPEGLETPVVLDGTRVLPTQRAMDGRGLFALGGIPAGGYKAFTVTEGKPQPSKIRISARAIDTPFYKLRLNAKGQLTSVYDKRAGREVLREGERGNVLMSYEDKPHNYDAWDVNNYYIEKSWEIDDIQSVEVIERGAVRASLRVTRKYLDSVIVQVMHVYEHSPRIDFETDVDWHEKQIFVKALFPVDVHTNEATYEIQYGHVKRPTHHNTSWDVARFEVCHHKWLDLSEDGYGVSVLNDCKYGAHVHNGLIGLSLLKSAVSPNETADRERHSFTYSILPHQGSWRDAGTLREAYALNNPAAARRKQGDGELPACFTVCATDQPNAVIEVVKRAEDSGAVIIRLYEAFGRRSAVNMKLFKAPVSACECSLMEEDDQPCVLEGDTIAFTLKPFEIKTFKVVFQ